jgi:hypothetical protein
MTPEMLCRLIWVSALQRARGALRLFKPSIAGRLLTVCRFVPTAVGFLLCQSAQATLYLQDAINYTASTQLGNNSPWASPTTYITVGTGSLSYSSFPDFSTSGNMLAIATAPSAVQTYRPFDTAAASGTVYFSFLIRVTATPSTVYYYLGLLPTGTTSGGGRTADPLVFAINSSRAPGVSGAGSSYAYSSTAMALSTTYLIILRYDFSARTSAIWVNPSSSTFGGNAPAADATTSGPTLTPASLGNVYLRAPSSGAMNLDTLRIGSTWAEVTATTAGNLPPTIPAEGQPQSQSVLNGANLSFTVSASGTAPLSYQWRKGGVNVTGANVSGTTTNQLSLTTVAASDAGSYDVVVTNAYGAATSTVAVLTINTGATASSWATIRSGTNCYQDISETSAGYLLVKYSTNIAPDIQSAGAAKAYLEFDLTGQSPNPNAPATLTVYSPSTSGQQNVTLWALNNAYAGMANTITWAAAQANDTNSNSMLTSGPLTATAITNVLAPDSPGPTYFTLPAPWGQFVQGNKLALAFTAFDSIAPTNSSAGFRMAVTNGGQFNPALMFAVLSNQPPTVLTQPQSQSVLAGATMSFTVTVNGSIPLGYQWRKDDAALGGATANPLTLSNVGADDAGSYDVVVTNDFGAVTSAVAVLTVNVAPLVTLQPQSQTNCGGTTATFTAAATGTPAPTVQWQESTNGGIIWADLPGAISTTYNPASVVGNNSKLYRAVFNNAGGTATSSTARLTVNSGPVAVTFSTNATQSQVFILSITTLLAACTAPDGDAFYLSSVGPLSTNGAPIAITTTNTVTYLPAPGFTGIDRFNYTITDILGCSATAEVQVTVGP